MTHPIHSEAVEELLDVDDAVVEVLEFLEIDSQRWRTEPPTRKELDEYVAELSRAQKILRQHLKQRHDVDIGGAS